MISREKVIGGTRGVAASLLSAALVTGLAPAVAQALKPVSSASQPAPNVSDLVIPALDGPDFRIADHAGSVVVLNFWGQWCQPCLEELPHLQRLNDELSGAGVVVAAVNTDGREFSDGMRRAFSAISVTLPILIDEDGAVNRRFSRASTTPFTVVIAPNGEVRWTHSGFDAQTMPALRRAIEAAKSSAG